MVVRANPMQLPIPPEVAQRILQMQVVNVTEVRWARLARKVLILLLYKFQFSARGQMLKEFKKLRAWKFQARL